MKDNPEKEKGVINHSDQTKKYLSFRVGGESYAIEISHIREIVIMTMKITDVPETAEYFTGVINLRGKIIPIIDIRKRFGLSEIEYDEKTCIVVVMINKIETGLIVERVAEVMDMSDKMITNAPEIGRKNNSRFISGMGKSGENVKMILDVARIISDEDMKIIENSFEQK